MKWNGRYYRPGYGIPVYPKKEANIQDLLKPLGEKEDKGNVWRPVLNQPLNVLKGTPTPPPPSSSPTPTPSITPTLTPTQTVTPTPTPTPSPAGLDTDYQAILTYATSQGYSLPSVGQQTLQNQLVVDLKNDGIWSDLDIFYVMATDGDEDFAKINWKSPGNYTLVENGTVDFTTDVGFKPNTNVIGNYLSTGFNLATNSVNYTLNDASRFAYDYDGIVTIYDGNTVDGGNRFRGTNIGGGNQEMRINGGNLVPPGIDTLGVGLKLLQRTSSTVENVYVGNSTPNTFTVNSTSITNQIQTLFRSGAVFGGGNLSIYGCGASLSGKESDLYIDINNYITSI